MAMYSIAVSSETEHERKPGSQSAGSAVSQIHSGSTPRMPRHSERADERAGEEQAEGRREILSMAVHRWRQVAAKLTSSDLANQRLNWSVMRESWRRKPLIIW